ncbi:OTU domain-containing protein 6 [Paragonimus westermani]|uniref:OTU domain-containing protein 6 n=1 Tax=Paragonimus westermani TaxID=34504 RepID=A0A5J4NQL8_9TREM|nr:OTU domain-containing protein 6 [Paragonimus westermani]
MHSEKLIFGTSDTTENVGSKELHKPSRAARRREKRAEQRRAQEEALSKAAASADLSSRGKEWKKIEEQLFSRKLRIYEIPSDGDCLYRSIAHQLIQRKIAVPDLQSKCPATDGKPSSFLDDPAHLAQSLRFLASHYLRENRDAFLSFMISPDSGGQMSDDEYNAYCDSVEKPSVWGGQVELSAARVCSGRTLQFMCSYFRCDMIYALDTITIQAVLHFSCDHENRLTRFHG